MSSRLVLATLSSILAAALTACGGSSRVSLAEATNRSCKTLSEASVELQRDLLRHNAKSTDLAITQAVTRYVIKLSEAADSISNADKVGGEKDFQLAASQRLAKSASALRSALAAAKSESLDAELAEKLQKTLKVKLPVVPSAIAKEAPRCTQSESK